MGYSRLEIRDDPFEGRSLAAAGETRKGGAYIARITGLDDRFRYAREFLGKKRFPKRGIVEVVVPVDELKAGDVLEIRRGGSWKNVYTEWILWEGDSFVSLRTEAEMRSALAAWLNKKNA